MIMTKTTGYFRKKYKKNDCYFTDKNDFFQKTFEKNDSSNDFIEKTMLLNERFYQTIIYWENERIRWIIINIFLGRMK